MEVLYLLIACSIVVLAAITVVFIWAVNARQFDELDTAAFSILDDEDVEHSEIERGRDGQA